MRTLSNALPGPTFRKWLPLLVGITAVLLPRIGSAPVSSNQSATTILPQGMTNHGDRNLLCSPSTWGDVATFTLANYIAHAATVNTQPGEQALGVLITMVFALLCPTFGVARGLRAIYQAAIFAETDLETAKKADALCAVVRTREWQPHLKHKITILTERTPDKYVKESRDDTRSSRGGIRLSGLVDGTHEAVEMDTTTQGRSNHSSIKRVMLDRDSLEDCFSPASKWYDNAHYLVHGICVLPPGYDLCVLGSTVAVREIGSVRAQTLSPGSTITYCQGRVLGLDSQHQPFLQPFKRDNKPPTVKLSSNLNISKALIAIFQLAYASVTLYRTKGDQIERYGYAAFGLTVIPYLIMSFVNLAGNVLTPNYPKKFLVHSKIMDEAKQYPGTIFEGVVGTVEPPAVPLDASEDGSEESAEEAAQDSVNADHITNRVANRFSEAVLIKDNIGRTFLLRGDQCPAEEVVFETRGEIESPERTRRLTITIAAGPNHTSKKLSVLPISLPLLCGWLLTGCLAIFLNASMTHLKPGGSTSAQRVWTMMRFSVLAADTVFQVCKRIWSTRIRAGTQPFPGSIAVLLYRLVVSLLGVAVGFVLPIGGFVVVVQMLREYGTCIRIPDGET